MRRGREIRRRIVAVLLDFEADEQAQSEQCFPYGNWRCGILRLSLDELDQGPGVGGKSVVGRELNEQVLDDFYGLGFGVLPCGLFSRGFVSKLLCCGLPEGAEAFRAGDSWAGPRSRERGSAPWPW